MQVRNIEVKLSRVTTLPILPNIAMEVLRLADDSGTSVREFERVISQDAGMTAKILRTANSPYYGGNGNILTLQRALAQLGVNAIRSISLTVSFQSAMACKQLNKGFNAQQYWQHSLAVACASKVIAVLKGGLMMEEAFIAGLLHDIGKLALSMMLPLEAELVYRMRDSQKVSDYEAEEKTLGMTHEQIGLLAAQKWNLPDIYYSPISKHHFPTDNVTEIDTLTAYVHLANVLAHEIEMGYDELGQVPELDYLVADMLAFPEEQYGPIRSAVGKEVAIMSKSFGL